MSKQDNSFIKTLKKCEFLTNLDLVGEIISSNNDKSINYLNEHKFNVKYVIVGTLTPYISHRKIVKRDFFYMSNDNVQYQIIDQTLQLDQLFQMLKKEIANAENTAVPINNMLENLAKQGILLLDIIDQSEINKIDASDDNILKFTLDRKSFAHPLLNDAVFICNSINAQEGLKMILGENDKRKIYFASQSRRVNTEIRLEQWKKAFNLK